MCSEPEGFKYFSEILSTQEAESLLEFIELQPWNCSLRRRTQHYGHLYKYSRVSNESAKALPLTAGLFQLFQRILLVSGVCDVPREKLQVIVNEYEPGVGISPHVDDPAQFGTWICGVSLLSNCLFTFAKQGKEQDVLLEERSLYVLSGDSRYKFTHQLKPKNVKSKRISVTYRYLN